MAALPLIAQFEIYRGSKENLLRKSAEKALVAERIATYVNGLVANNPDEKQMYVRFDCSGSRRDRRRGSVGDLGRRI